MTYKPGAPFHPLICSCNICTAGWRAAPEPVVPVDGNPKDAIGSTKLMMDAVPDSAIVGMSLAFVEGLLKYGRFNWRAFPVRFSIYDAAAMRHRAKMRAGEWSDQKTKIPHIYSIMACYAIIADARLSGTLTDDRPPAQPALLEEIDKLDAEIQAGLKELFKQHDPKHWTFNDTVPANAVR